MLRANERMHFSCVGTFTAIHALHYQIEMKQAGDVIECIFLY